VLGRLISQLSPPALERFFIYFWTALLLLRLSLRCLLCDKGIKVHLIHFIVYLRGLKEAVRWIDTDLPPTPRLKCCAICIKTPLNFILKVYESSHLVV